MPIGTRRAADVLARRLRDAGCQHAFGMPGGEVLTLVDALEAAGIKFHLTKHENAAGFMAEGVHHVDGAPAILVATVGPGAMNGVNVVANADQDRVPLIVLTGCVDEDEAPTYTHQVLDQQAVFRPITKASFRLTAGAADIIADKAVALATEPRQGPVHIDVPINVANASAPADNPAMRAAAEAATPSADTLGQMRRWLSSAKRPLAIVGLDVLEERSAATVGAFLEKFSIPFVTTYKAKGVLPEDHPLCLGGAGLSPLADRHLLPLVRSADLILTLGYDPIEMRVGWRDVWDPQTQRVIDISAVPNTHYMHQATMNFVGHTGETLAALTRMATPKDTWDDGAPNTVRAELAKAFPATDRWGPGAVIGLCRELAPKGTLASADSGAHRILLSQMWRCDAPKELVQSSGLCTMGCAVPLAMGLKMAAPDRTVISFSGDAGFLMVAGELSTCAEMGLKPIFVVFVDGSLALIELKQRERQLPNRGVDFARHDFAAIGRAFGGYGHTVRNKTELADAMGHALSADAFTVIAAEIEQESYDGRI